MSDKIREAFEASWRKRYGNTLYCESEWRGWQAALTQQPAPVNKSVIRDVFLRNGFTIKEGQTDLKPYVYAAAEELLSLDGKAVAASAAPVAVQPLPYWAPCNPACDPELNGSRSKLCDCAQATAALAAPPATKQPDTVAVPRELLAEAESIIESYAEALKASHAPGGDWEGEEAAQDGYEREAGVASKLRRLLAGGAE